MQKLSPIMTPSAGQRLQRFVGDRVRFEVSDRDGQVPKGWKARLRTNLGRGAVLDQEIIRAHANKIPIAGASWRDLPMTQGMNSAGVNGWFIELPLAETGYYKAKAYLIDPKGWQHWPDGPDLGISVHPDAARSANTIYCAFTRMFGPTLTAFKTEDETLAKELKKLDDQDYSVIPPSGKLRDLTRQLPHIMDNLGCRILHLLPVNPTPTTYARFGRFGSPYACEDLTMIDLALVEFDKRATGVDQFKELTYATHTRGGRVFLDMVINHTGWGSTLQENSPDWFLRRPDGEFISPGAWGNTWEDLVELEHRHVELWDYLAEVFLIWCRRGVDGFRCDAGYKVPMAAWQYITARVRGEFPDAIFLLEGLGGSWEATELLLTEGGMQWAYSELFQNYSGGEIASYMDYVLKQTGHTGLYVHYSETHDNNRLASKGKAWSLMRNRLCALTAPCGGFGFTCGVEWLAPERVNVHSSRGLAWNNPDNIVKELAGLNRLVSGHPCFFDEAKLTRVSSPDSPVYALLREAPESGDRVLVLANSDENAAHKILLDAKTAKTVGGLLHELTGQALPEMTAGKDGSLEVNLGPGACVCLSSRNEPAGLSGDAYRLARAQAAWALKALSHQLSVEEVPDVPWRDLARIAAENPVAFLSACSKDPKTAGERMRNLLSPSTGNAIPNYQPVVQWNLRDCRRVTPVPPDHWLLITDDTPFRATLEFKAPNALRHLQSIAMKSGHAVCFEPVGAYGDAVLKLERYSKDNQNVTAGIRFLEPGPNVQGALEASASEASANLVLLTNGLGGMARMGVDFGAIQSKYDCLLAANLNPRVPVDRHVFAKRARIWLNADGFISPLDAYNLVSFNAGPAATWRFLAQAGDGRTVEIHVCAFMPEGLNTTVLRMTRVRHNLETGKILPAECDVRLTVRVDIEDRNFHWETKRNGGAEHHFTSNTAAMKDQAGFAFTPATDRQLRVYSNVGVYHPQPEWSENIPHPVEQSRGQTGSGDAYSPGWFEIPLSPESEAILVVTADAVLPAKSALNPPVAPTGSPADLFAATLLKAAREFVVRRDDAVTVIAGYPWFLDWGRDSLICARGLLAGGLSTEVKQLLAVFGRFEKDGTLPNTIHGDDASNRDTSDAPLWYGVVCEEVAKSSKAFYKTAVDAQGRTILDVLTDIAAHYISGTPNGIRMDAASGLIWSPSHFTWMDTNYPAGTPREGYPVEIQVLWIRLLRQLQRVSKPADSKRWETLADLAQSSLQKYFWIEEKGWLADLLIAKPGQAAANAVRDDALRSNCLFAVSLGIITGERARLCVEAARRYLVVPGALRTLAPLPVSPPLPVYGNNGQLLNYPSEPYWGRYEGDEDTRRKPAYHNGTAWLWTFPVFCEALALAWDCSPEAVAAARSYLGSMDTLLAEGCIGQLPEIVDGDAPHKQRGCDAQAWSVTEALRVWKFLKTK
jgi:predicted glycogen debranching enzyme